MIWTRREFLRLSSAGLVAGALPVHALGRSRAAEFEELRRGVGTFTGQGGTIGWLVNGDGCLVVDSQFPDTARSCVEGLRERATLPLDALVNTHHHGDHTAGNAVLGEVSRTIVAHVRVPELQRQAAQGSGNEEEQSYPETTFEESWSVTIGDETVRATHYEPAHTGGDATVRFEEANIVHMGDLVFNRLYPFIDRAGGASVRGWIRLLEQVASENPSDALYIFGHGQPGFGVVGGRDDVLLQRDFLAALLEEAERAVREGRSREELAAREELPGFGDHVAPSGRLTLGLALGTAYDEVVEG